MYLSVYEQKCWYVTISLETRWEQLWADASSATGQEENKY